MSWYFGEALGLRTARERRIVAWAGFAPDVDVLAYVGALAYYRDKDLAFENVWQVVHHRYTHNLSFVLLIAVVAWWLADRTGRARVALLALVAAAIHNFFDIVAGGPTWPVYPLWPFSDLGFSASWSWTIGEWPNMVVLFACLAGMFVYARIAGRSPFECFGDRADAWFVRTTRGGATASGGFVRWLIWAAILIVVIAVLAPLGFDIGG